MELEDKDDNILISFSKDELGNNASAGFELRKIIQEECHIIGVSQTNSPKPDIFTVPKTDFVKLLNQHRELAESIGHEKIEAAGIDISHT